MLNLKTKPASQGKSKTRVGLDIGSDSLKIMEIAVSDKPRLMALGMKKIADHSQDAITDSIKALVEEARIVTKEINISVSGPSVIVRFITMPKMKENELASAIKFEAEKFIPFNINDCLIDFQILGKDDRENKISILLVVAKKAHVRDHVKAVNEAGLSTTIVDVDSFALVNSFLKNFPSIDPSKSFALINIGASLTNLSILRGPSVQFARDVVMGANDFTAAIGKRLGLDIKTAEELKTLPADKAQDVINFSKQALSGFLDDVRLSFSYYENQVGLGIDEIYLSGGAASFAGLNEAFEENFGTKPALWDPLQFLDTSSVGAGAKIREDFKSSFAIASGLTLR